MFFVVFVCLFSDMMSQVAQADLKFQESRIALTFGPAFLHFLLPTYTS